MTNPFETLRKILQNEAARGYDNKGMVGGIEKMSALTTKLVRQFAKGAELEKAIRGNLKVIGYEF